MGTRTQARRSVSWEAARKQPELGGVIPHFSFVTRWRREEEVEIWVVP